MRDLGRILRTARQAARLSLQAMANRTNYSKPYLGQVETGKRKVTPDLVQAYEQALGIDVERLAAVTQTPRRADTATLADLASILATTRRLEDAAGVRAVLPAVNGFATLAATLAENARAEIHGSVLSLASEIDQYRGWLETATGDHRNAIRVLDRAVSLATEANDPERLTHGLSFGAYAALERGQLTDAADLTDAALGVANVHPLLRVYDHYQRARVLAAAGETHAAQSALLVADKVADRHADTDPPPDSAYWYTYGFWGLERGRVLQALGQTRQAQDEVRAGLAAMPYEHRTAAWATEWVRAAEGVTEVPL